MISCVYPDWDGEEFNKLKEQAICKLGELFADLRCLFLAPILAKHNFEVQHCRRVDEINKLLVSIRPFFSSIPKAKTAKIGK